MRKYKITYKDEGQEQIAVLVGADERKAVHAFSVKFPNVPKEQILSVSPLEPNHGKATHRRRGPSGGLGYNSQYEVARKVALFTSFVGWVCFLLGVVAVIAGITDRSYNESFLMAVSPGLILSFSGILLVAAAQVTRATVDNADHTREILNLLIEKK